ncbi:FadR family transcriptional regulator [Lachnospiraceae bacterium DSM 108991]|uniref:FadR family transcriptional regulator n=1 Tax=Claveliimonas monacensis TaxID=2779351 RepID=A0ABR9RJ64_9FIRM|nr:GntR family transcriptional regulator [Claveliimonas monacensis]MBE5063001.1 FadR family transcriptional regulator [Claveliimonas monacensis]
MNEKKAASDIVKEYVFDQIESKKLIIGSRLPTEKQLAAQLNVSRTSVREALQSLKGVGLVKSTRGSGYQIVSNTENILSDALRAIMSIKNIQFTDISNIREALEIKAAELSLTSGISQQDIEYLENCIDNMEESTNIMPEKSFEYDILFHRKIAELSRNEFINSFILALSSFSNKYILVSWDKVRSNEAYDLFKIHREILCYLKDHNIDRVIDKIKEHYKIADNIITNHIQFEKKSKDKAENILEQLLSKGYTSNQIVSGLSNLINDADN